LWFTIFNFATFNAGWICANHRQEDIKLTQRLTGAPQSYIDGYDVRFAQKYDKDRADECADIPGDQYNASWGYGCIDSGLTEADCNDHKE
jgi:hypothetical protein